MKTFLSNLWAALCGRPVVVPGLIKDGERWKLMTAADLQAMKTRWKTHLTGHSRDPEILAILEMIEYRIWQADMLAQGRKNHAGAVGLVHYANGESAGLNDLLTEILRTVHAVEAPPTES